MSLPSTIADLRASGRNIIIQCLCCKSRFLANPVTMPGNDYDYVETHLLPCPDCQENAATIIAQTTMAYPNYRRNAGHSAVRPERNLPHANPFNATSTRANSDD